MVKSWQIRRRHVSTEYGARTDKEGPVIQDDTSNRNSSNMNSRHMISSNRISMNRACSNRIARIQQCGDVTPGAGIGYHGPPFHPAISQLDKPVVGHVSWLQGIQAVGI
ncbi:hypothetical protein PoB_005940000 [Plakobranchus ocellatus]|uniref:Uncharacterized protein n=1 Tax=Plakobranchus ocellatus TaxID=259542 RepID=A0AAV4CM46_9GAST|nr:hypothetical protein PoB_005940000 [Plakobranchus ocellatus]